MGLCKSIIFIGCVMSVQFSKFICAKKISFSLNTLTFERLCHFPKNNTGIKQERDCRLFPLWLKYLECWFALRLVQISPPYNHTSKWCTKEKKKMNVSFATKNLAKKENWISMSKQFMKTRNNSLVWFATNYLEKKIFEDSCWNSSWKY